jgi:hypothetical protein
VDEVQRRAKMKEPTVDGKDKYSFIDVSNLPEEPYMILSEDYRRGLQILKDELSSGRSEE